MDREAICILHVEKLTNNTASVRLPAPLSHWPVCPLGHGPLLSTLVFKKSLETPGCCCPERMNMSAVPTAPWVFFQLPRSHLIHPGFSDQCEQQDTIIIYFQESASNFLKPWRGKILLRLLNLLFHNCLIKRFILLQPYWGHLTRFVAEINDTLHSPELAKDTAEVLLRVMDS